MAELQQVVRSAAALGQQISIAGGRHAMGGQQFGRGTLLLDMRHLNRVLELDAERGLVTMEAGIEWPSSSLIFSGRAAPGLASGESFRSRPEPTG